MIVPLVNPAAFDVEPVRDLFARAFAGDRPVAPEVARTELRKMVGTGRVKVLVGRSHPIRYAALAVVILPSSPLAPEPQVYHFFNDGPPELRRELISAVVETLKGAGYNAFRALNGNGFPEDVWKRLFRSAGDMEKIGTAYRIQFGVGNS